MYQEERFPAVLGLLDSKASIHNALEESSGHELRWAVYLILPFFPMV